MMDIETTDLGKKRILTTKCPLVYEQETDLICLSHEYLHPCVDTTKSIPLTLQSLNFHRNNPYTLQNSSITSSLFQHEQKYLEGPEDNKKNKQMVIVDCSKYNNNTIKSDLLKKYNVVKGFTCQLPSQIIPSNNKKNILPNNQKEIEASTSEQFISKQLEYQFTMATSQEQSGFIGLIQLSLEAERIQIQQNFHQDTYKKIFKRVCKCYQGYCSKTNCPIFITLAKNKSVAGFQWLSIEDKADNISNKIVQMKDQLKLLQQLFSNRDLYKNIVLSNPYLLFVQTVQTDQKGQIFIQQKSDTLQQVRNLYKLGFNVCFQIARYQKREALLAIGILVKQFPKQTILAYGIRWKTDMKMFGGEGLAMQNSIKIIKSAGLNNKQIFQARNNNILKILAWNFKKEQIKIINMWKCGKCNKQSPQTLESFRKYGSQFCSIGCLRSFKS